MYRCERCGELFDDPEMRTEVVGEYMGAPAKETYAVCPWCGDDELEEMNRCICGGWKAKTADYCDECIKARDEIVESSIIELERWLNLDYVDASKLLRSFFEEPEGL